MSSAYHPQSDEQSEQPIQTLEDMLRACCLDWKGSWAEVGLRDSGLLSKGRGIS